MIYKCTNGFVMFTFESIQEFEMLKNVLPIPNLIPYSEKPMSFVPECEGKLRYIIAGSPVSPLAVPVKSNADLIHGFKENRFTYSIFQDDIVLKEMITTKVSLKKNRFGKYVGDFMLQPYSFVGFEGRAADFEAVYLPDQGVFVYTYIRFVYE